MDTHGGPFYTRDEAADILGKHVNTIDRWIYRGLLGYKRIGGSVRISQSHIDRFLARAERQSWVQPELPFEDGATS